MQPPPHLVYAGFWLRFAAYFIDTLIISIGTFIVAFIIAMICIFVGGAMGLATSLKQANTNDASPAMVAVIIVLEFVLWAAR